MKLKVVLASTAVVAIAVVAFAFTSKKATQTYYYLSGTENQRLAPGHISDVDPLDRTIVASTFENMDNWSVSAQSFTPTSDYSQFIGSITFNEENDADGGSDGQLTLQEALNAVFAQYSAPSPDVMQSSYTVDGNAIVSIAAATAKH